MGDITHNLRFLRAEIAQTLGACGRDGDSICLVAVSKKKPLHAVLAAHAAGQIDFGENYAQEFLTKWDHLQHLALRWHFIGHLQTNKVRDVVGRAHLIHTLDRKNLGDKIESVAAAKNIVQDCLIEVQLSTDTAKTGCPMEDVAELLRHAGTLPHVRVRGLMTVGTLTQDEALTRAEFSRLRDLLADLNRQKISAEPLTELSMGMTHDWRLALACGATILRIGTGIFGERE